jgi:uncharacterized protein YqgC (DUF456 family)
MNILAALVLTAVVILCWLAQLVGLPGNWLIVLATAVYAWWFPPDAPTAIGWNVVIALAVLAVLGEIVESAAGAVGVSKVGGSRRSSLLAIVGSLVGSIVGVFVGLPIPLVGSLVAAVIFGAVGATIGALVGESWKGRDLDASLEVGKAAFVGRLLGTVGKTIVCSIMVVVTLAALVF